MRELGSKVLEVMIRMWAWPKVQTDIDSMVSTELLVYLRGALHMVTNSFRTWMKYSEVSQDICRQPAKAPT